MWQWDQVDDFDPEEYQVGVDEAGRGPCFGPVVAAAVLLPDPPKGDTLWSKVTDSKKVGGKLRNRLEGFIKEEAGGYGVGIGTVEEIVEHNIRNATFMAMHRAVQDLEDRWHATYKGVYPLEIDRLLIDGNAFKPYKTIPHLTLVKGDYKSKAIAAASILAKTARDRMIGDLCDAHPCLDTWYSLRSNQGYPTPQHKRGIDAHGITQFHRTKDAPCRSKPRVFV
jgi:ribonuclease HII